MTAEEKARELIQKFIEPTKVPNVKGVWVEDISGAIQCAIITVDEVINHTWTNEQYQRLMNLKPYEIYKEMTTEYWQEVKSHLLKM